MQVKTDAAGNLRGRYAGASSTSLMIGSHLDTVPNSGAFDGMLGVMLGLALVESLDGERLPFSIELVAFSEEEGVRFHLPFIGSRALVGRVDSDFLATTDGDGISIAQAITILRTRSPQDKRLPGWRRCGRLPGVPHRAGHSLGERRQIPGRSPRYRRANPRGDDLYRPGAPCRHDTDAAAQRRRGGRGGVGRRSGASGARNPGPGSHGRRVCAPTPGPET